MLRRTRQPEAAAPRGEDGPTGDLRLVGLTRRFGRHTAVDGLDLVVPQGTFFALVGPSGCGKTTTLRMVAGLEQPDEGRVLIGERDVTALRPHRRPVNTVFQSYALFPHLSVADNVAFGPRRRRLPREVVAEQVREALALVEMGGMADRRPAQLSGGQQQRVAVARAVVNRPEVLLLDEPLGALDLKLRRQMQVELKRLQSATGLTFVHVTHDQEEAMSMADSVAVMRDGQIEQLGAPAELYDLPRTSFVANFLGQSNLAPARVVGAEGDLLVLELAGQRVRVLRSRTAAQDARRVLLGVRPEKVRVVAAGDKVRKKSVANALTRATVRDVSFTGVATQYLVDVPGAGAWTVYEQNVDVESTARPGDQVTIAWDLRHSFTLPGDDDPLAGLSADVVDLAEIAAEERASSDLGAGPGGATVGVAPRGAGDPRS
ncbi:ABC transporter ATP-binding protein [Arsenicicoccus dermatophilus]|uniref:ABC transporter ATP-binding protein n=1 Tax=Arsenicicoccus dermatophilus TaxID=1076331 RepID=UPI001F4CA403|nr:ABC transporter ATP-binding protein [Arsenicicoccus dermatophilus]MCH8612879.1 ABC transporter ATP-binding protein [Arsenicicoccus dermatophilus]